MKKLNSFKKFKINKSAAAKIKGGQPLDRGEAGDNVGILL